MHLLVHQPHCLNYSYFRSFLQSVPKSNTSSFYLEQVIPLSFLNTQIADVRILAKNCIRQSNADALLYDALLLMQKSHEKEINKHINDVYTPSLLVQEYKKKMMIHRKVGMGNIDKLCETVIKMTGIMDMCREFLLSDNCPLAFLEKKYGQYISTKNSKVYSERGCIEEVSIFVNSNYSRDEYSAEVCSGRMLYGEVFVLTRMGDYGKIEKLFSDFEFFFENTCKGFTSLYREYIRSKKPCQGNKKNLMQSEEHRCRGELQLCHRKMAQRIINEVTSNDQFLIVILNIIVEKNTSTFLKTLEDYIWYHLTVKTPDSVLKNMFENYSSKEGKLLFFVMLELYDDAMDHLFSQDFDVCESYTLMKLICEKRKTEREKLFVELSFAVAKNLREVENKVKMIGDLEGIVSLSTIAEYVVENNMIATMHRLKMPSLIHEVAIKLSAMNCYELIVRNYAFFSDEILIDSFNELVIQNLLGNITTSEYLINEAFNKIVRIKNGNLRKSYVLKQFMTFKSSYSISDLNDLFQSDYLLIDSMDVYEKIATYAAKTIRCNKGHLAREFNEFMNSTGLSKELIDRLNSELVGYL